MPFLWIILCGACLGSRTPFVSPANPAAESHGGGEQCRLKTVTASGVPAAGATRRDGQTPGGWDAGEKMSLAVRSDFPGELAVVDDLQSSETPYFVIEISGPSEEIARVYWKQAWLANGTFYFHVHARDAASAAAAPPPQTPLGPRGPTQPTPLEHDRGHMLRVFLMGGLIALLLLVLLVMLALFARRRWRQHPSSGGSICCPRGASGQSKMTCPAGAELANNEIHYIPSALLGGTQTQERRLVTADGRTHIQKQSAQQTQTQIQQQQLQQQQPQQQPPQQRPMLFSATLGTKCSSTCRRCSPEEFAGFCPAPMVNRRSVSAMQQQQQQNRPPQRQLQHEVPLLLGRFACGPGGVAGHQTELRLRREAACELGMRTLAAPQMGRAVAAAGTDGEKDRENHYYTHPAESRPSLHSTV
ncbi:uncharacterized protein LOC144937859 [Lampetra fluviatilis]